MRTAAWLLAVAVCAGLLALSVGPGWINGNLFALLPKPERNPQVAAVMQRVQQQTTNQILALTVAKKPAEAARAARAYAAVLRRSGLFKSADAGLPVKPGSVTRLYHRYRFQLLSASERRKLNQTSVQGLAQQAVRRAYSAPGEVSGREIATDPLGIFRRTLSAQLPHGDWQLYQGTPVRHTRNGYAGVVRAVLAISPFALKQQAPLSKVMANAVRAAHGQGQVSVLTAGVLWHALAQAKQARFEISTIGTGSMIGVVLLIVLVFRSLRPLLIGALSLGSGTLAALAATQLIFGYVHLFTLIFGASLIGVAVDYSLHVFADRFAGGDAWTPSGAVSRLLPGLLLALGTSVLGYAALAVAPMPGLRQIACFSGIGLIAAWGTVVLLVPRWGGPGGARPAPRPALWSAAVLRRLHDRPVIVLLCLLGVAIPGWLGAHFSDNVQALRMRMPQRDAMEHRVRKLLGAADSSEFFLVTANDRQTLLRREHRLGQQLDRLTRRGALGRWRGIVQSVPPKAQQAANYRLLKDKVYGPQGAAPEAWRRLGFSQAHIAAREQAFRQAASRRLTLAEWLSSPASQAQRQLWLGRLTRGELGSVVLLGGVHDLAALNALHLPGVRLVDPAADYSAVLATQRRHVSLFLLAAYALVSLILMAMYGLRGGLATIVPPLAASALAVSALGWTGQPLDLFALFSLLLVLGIGVDYSIFLREAGHEQRSMGAWSAVCMSALTTILSFGLLALSKTPAIHRFGFTLLIGIAAAWMLAPVAQYAIRRSRVS